MVKVHLHKVTRKNFRDCLNLQIAESQKSLIATTKQSLAEAYVDFNLVPLAVYIRFKQWKISYAVSHLTEVCVKLEDC